MNSGYRFGAFVLDLDNRRLRRGETTIEVNARYFDALALLVRNAGQLVSKERFFAEVWHSAAVTDEALTQCIKSLRQLLGDKSAAPSFIETVPKHGYRFIAPVEPMTERVELGKSSWLAGGAAGTLGAVAAGAIGGLVYGLAAGPGSPMGAVSVLLVLLWVTMAAALAGGAGVGFGIAAARRFGGPGWAMGGGALGGALVGGGVKLVGLDAFNLLLGQSPGEITGAAEGLALGAGVGLAAAVSAHSSLRRALASAAAIGAISGAAITLTGGRLMAGSLALLADNMAQSRFNFSGIAKLFGEPVYGPVTAAATGALEGALFAACIVGAMGLAARR